MTLYMIYIHLFVIKSEEVKIISMFIIIFFESVSDSQMILLKELVELTLCVCVCVAQ